MTYQSKGKSELNKIGHGFERGMESTNELGDPDQMNHKGERFTPRSSVGGGLVAGNERMRMMTSIPNRYFFYLGYD